MNAHATAYMCDLAPYLDQSHGIILGHEDSLPWNTTKSLIHYLVF